jgi:hypothetical protein
MPSILSMVDNSGADAEAAVQSIPNTVSTQSWCPNINTTQEKPTFNVTMESLYFLTSLDFINTNNVKSISIHYSTEGSTWNTYTDPATVNQVRIYSF